MKNSTLLVLVVVGLACLAVSTEGSKLSRLFRRVGKASEKVGKKALEDGLVTAVIGKKLLKRSINDDDLPTGLDTERYFESGNLENNVADIEDIDYTLSEPYPSKWLNYYRESPKSDNDKEDELSTIN